MTEERNMLVDLLAAIDKLTTEYRDAHWLQDDDTDKTAIVRIKRDGLLKQLRESIAGGIGSHAGSSDPRTRIPIDAGALELYNQIEENITEWFVEYAKQPVHLDPETNLRQWFILFKVKQEQGRIPHEIEREYLRIVEGWVHSIEAKFDPPKTLELTVNEFYRSVDSNGNAQYDENGDPIYLMDGDRRRVKARHLAECPLCGAQRAFDPKNGDQMPALILEFRDEGNQTLENATGLCRSCAEVWRGGHRVRLLSWEVGQQEIALNTPQPQVAES